MNHKYKGVTTTFKTQVQVEMQTNIPKELKDICVSSWWLMEGTLYLGRAYSSVNRFLDKLYMHVILS